MLLHKVTSLKHDPCVCEIPRFLPPTRAEKIIVELRDIHRSDTNS